MKRWKWIALGSCWLASTGWGGEADSSLLWDQWGRIGARGHIAYNIEADFTGLGGIPQQNNPGPPSGGNIDRAYDNGFVRVDISDNAGDQTCFWGYDSAGQIDNANDHVVMTSLSAPTSGRSTGLDDPPSPGAELLYRHAVYERGSLKLRVESGLGWTRIRISDDRVVQADAIRTKDAFDLGGIVPPSAPYEGTFEEPGPVIGSVPDRATERVAIAVTIRGDREIEADQFQIRLGPVVEYEFRETISVMLSGGGVAGWINSRFAFDESARLEPNGRRMRRRGSDNQSELLGGAYVEGGFELSVTDRIALGAGARFQTLEAFSQRIDEAEAELDLGESLYLFAGIQFAF